MNELVSWEDKCKQWEPNHKKLVCPVLHKTSQEWFVVFADLKAHIPISILHCNDSKLKLDDYKKYGQTFLEKAHEAFVQLSLTSPFTKFVSKSLTRVPDLHFHRNYKDSTLASMLCLQWYNGHSSFPVKKIDEGRIITLAYLVLHKENTAVLPEEIEEVLNKKSKKKVSLVALNFWLWVLLVRPTFTMLVVHDC